jgi:hypothetical protein
LSIVSLKPGQRDSFGLEPSLTVELEGSEVNEALAFPALEVSQDLMIGKVVPMGHLEDAHVTLQVSEDTVLEIAPLLALAVAGAVTDAWVDPLEIEVVTWVGKGHKALETALRNDVRFEHFYNPLEHA